MTGPPSSFPENSKLKGHTLQHNIAWSLQENGMCIGSRVGECCAKTPGVPGSNPYPGHIWKSSIAFDLRHKMWDFNLVC